MNHATREIVNECHQLAWSAPHRGAKTAKISITEERVDYEDDAGTTRSWDARKVHPKAPFPLAHLMDEFNAPQGLELDLVVASPHHPDREPSVTRIPQAGQDAAISGPTDDGRYTVHLTLGNVAGPMVITNPDGTTAQHHIHTYLTLRQLDPQSTERLVKHETVRVSAVASWNAPERAGPGDADNVMRTACGLLCDLIERINRDGGAAWTDYAKPLEDMPEYWERLPAAPDTGSRLPSGHQGREQVVLPADAVRLDAAHPAQDAIARAWEQQDPPPPRHLYQTNAEGAPTLRITEVEVTERPGVTTVYPGPLHHDDPAHESDEALRARLGESRADNVDRITLQYVISYPDGAEETGALDCKAYADYDRYHEILLVTNDCGMSAKELDDALGARDFMRSYLNRCEESLSDMRLRQITEGLQGEEAQQGLEQALGEMANELARSTAPFLGLGGPATGSSDDGAVSITVGPAARDGGGSE